MSWLPKNKIIVPVDFSGESDRAIQTALETFENPVNVHLVHVLSPLDTVSPGVVGATSPTRNVSRRSTNVFKSS